MSIKKEKLEFLNLRENKIKVYDYDEFDEYSDYNVLAQFNISNYDSIAMLEIAIEIFFNNRFEEIYNPNIPFKFVDIDNFIYESVEFGDIDIYQKDNKIVLIEG